MAVAFPGWNYQSSSKRHNEYKRYHWREIPNETCDVGDYGSLIETECVCRDVLNPIHTIHGQTTDFDPLAHPWRPKLEKNAPFYSLRTTDIEVKMSFWELLVQMIKFEVVGSEERICRKKHCWKQLKWSCSQFSHHKLRRWCGRSSSKYTSPLYPDQAMYGSEWTSVHCFRWKTSRCFMCFRGEEYCICDISFSVGRRLEEIAISSKGVRFSHHCRHWKHWANIARSTKRVSLFSGKETETGHTGAEFLLSSNVFRAQGGTDAEKWDRTSTKTGVNIVQAVWKESLD